MTVHKNNLRRIALVVVCCVAATGCQRSDQPIVNPDMVWAIGAKDAKPGGLAQTLAALWNSQNRHSTVRVHALPAGADDQRRLMATEMNAELDNIDILTLDVVWTGEFAVNSWLVDLEDHRRQIEEVSLPAPRQSATWEEKLWAAPFISDAGLLYYRTDLVTRPPTTWKELMEVGLAAKRKDPNLTPFVGQGAQYEGMVVNYLEYLAGSGATLFNQAGTDVDYPDAAARQALEFMRDAREAGLYDRGFATMDEGAAQKRFEAGDVIFMRNWPAAYSEMQGDTKVKGRFGIAPLPTFDGTGSSSITGGSNLAVSRFSQYRKGATEFALWASTDPEVQQLLAERFTRGPALAAVYDQVSASPVIEQLGRILPGARARPSTPEWSTISDEIQQNIFPAYTANSTPEELANAVKRIRSFLELTASTTS